VTSFEYGENPAPVWTRIRYKYVVDPVRPESSNDVLLAVGWLICEYPPVVVRRSTLKSTIPAAVVLHDKRTCDEEVAVPCRVGAGGNGRAGVAAEVSLEYEDSPPLAPSELIRYVYVVAG
jgi:hypothetical protein